MKDPEKPEQDEETRKKEHFEELYADYMRDLVREAYEYGE